MHIFNIPETYLQIVEMVQWKFQEELFSQSMYYQPLFTKCNCQKMAKLKALSVWQYIYITFFSASIFHMHIFNMSVTNLQSVERI